MYKINDHKKRVSILANFSPKYNLASIMKQHQKNKQKIQLKLRYVFIHIELIRSQL